MADDMKAEIRKYALQNAIQFDGKAIPTATEAELKTARDYAVKAKGPAAVIDLTWALINSSEFLYRH